MILHQKIVRVGVKSRLWQDMCADSTKSYPYAGFGKTKARGKKKKKKLGVFGERLKCMFPKRSKICQMRYLNRRQLGRSGPRPFCRHPT